MTFTEIQTEILDRLSINTTDAQTRVGRAINRLYKRITTTCGLNTTRQVIGASQNVTIGNPVVTFTSIEKIVRVYDNVPTGTLKELKELPLIQLMEIKPKDSDSPTYWAHQSGTGTSVSIRLDVNPLTGFNLKADGYSTVATLSGSDVPVIPESFHDILIAGVLADEYKKAEKIELARDEKLEFEQRLSDLRYFLAKSAFKDIHQDSKVTIKYFDYRNYN